MYLKDRIALVTGAGGGIGRAICSVLAKAGANIILFGGNNLSNLEETASLVRSFGVKADIVAGDLTDENFIKVGFEKALNLFGKIDILINNAGLALNSPLENTPIQTFDKIMAVNVRAPYILIQQALPTLKKSDRASIINIASVVSHLGYPNQSAYSASKHALLGLTKALANEVYKDGIRVHAISPGGVYTDMVKVTRPDLTPDGMIMPEDIAEVVEFFLKNRSNAVVDEVIVHRATKEPFLV